MAKNSFMHEVPVLDLLGDTWDSIRDLLKGMFQECLHLKKGKEYNIEPYQWC